MPRIHCSGLVGTGGKVGLPPHNKVVTFDASGHASVDRDTYDATLRIPGYTPANAAPVVVESTEIPAGLLANLGHFGEEKIQRLKEAWKSIFGETEVTTEVTADLQTEPSADNEPVPVMDHQRTATDPQGSTSSGSSAESVPADPVTNHREDQANGNGKSDPGPVGVPAPDGETSDDNPGGGDTEAPGGARRVAAGGAAKRR